MAFSSLSIVIRSSKAFCRQFNFTLGMEAVSTKLYPPTRPIVRSMSHMSKKLDEGISSTFKHNFQEFGWRSSRGLVNIHTKGDAELAQFLTDEIAAESKAQKSPKLPKIEGFDVKTDGPAVTLTKKFNDELVTVKLNVNHTVDTDVQENTSTPEQDKPEIGEMKAKPQFTVEIEKGGKVLGFSCSYVEDYSPQGETDPDAFNDIFNIDEVVFHSGEWKETTYAVSGEIIDGYLYDLLMNFLEERGVSSEFGEKLIEYSTSYEHKLYINLLESVKSFVSGGK